jgi:tetratricopeptide (TPR) repeat protein
MKRESLVFALAGTIFGFVLGYMAAGIRDETKAGAPATRPTGGAAAASPAAHNHPLAPPDPDEVRTLEALAARDKANVQVRVQLGDLNMDHGRHAEAARWYREALAVQPDLAGPRVDLGAALLNLGRPEEAVAELDLVLGRDPAHKKALFNKGLALMQAGRTAEAVRAWESLLERYPGDPQLDGLKEQLERLKSGSGAPGAS